MDGSVTIKTRCKMNRNIKTCSSINIKLHFDKTRLKYGNEIDKILRSDLLLKKMFASDLNFVGFVAFVSVSQLLFSTFLQFLNVYLQNLIKLICFLKKTTSIHNANNVNT